MGCHAISGKIIIPMLKGSSPMKCLRSIALMPSTVCLLFWAWVNVGRVPRSPRCLRSLTGGQGFEEVQPLRAEMPSPGPKPLALL